MRKMLAICFAALLLWPLGAGAELRWITQEEFDELYGPFCRLEGDTLILKEGVTVLGSYYGEDVWDEETQDWHEEYDPEIKAIFDGEWLGFSAEEVVFSRVVWPASLRYIATSAFDLECFDAFTLPDTVEAVFHGAFVYCDFPVFRIEADIPWKQIRDSFYDCSLHAWDVPEDHPRYKVIDGVLFSRDGKTLYSYPNARTDTHYDVPKGVEKIAVRAFGNEYLQTVTLPIGLKSIGSYGFAGCTRLHSIALPLTVEKIANDVFSGCVSLELVSLPDGVQADKKESWSQYYEGDSIYRGDNGDTADAKKQTKYRKQYLGAVARLAGGGTRIPVFADEQAKEPVDRLPEGRIVVAGWAEAGRCQVNDAETDQELGWVDMRYLQGISNETLFSYAAVRLPRRLSEDGETDLPLVTGSWSMEWLGPFVYAAWDRYDPETLEYERTGEGQCLMWEAEIYRAASGPAGEYGYVYGDDPYAPIPLRNAPNGEETSLIYPGDQVKVLERAGAFAHVSTGLAEGWVPDDQLMTVPMLTEDVH